MPHPSDRNISLVPSLFRRAAYSICALALSTASASADVFYVGSHDDAACDTETITAALVLAVATAGPDEQRELLRRKNELLEVERRLAEGGSAS